MDIFEDITEETEIKIRNSTDALIKLSELNRVVCLFTDTKAGGKQWLDEILADDTPYRICIYSGLSRSFLHQYCNISVEKMYFVREGVAIQDIQPQPGEVLIIWNFFEFQDPSMFMDEVKKNWDYVFFISIVDYLAMARSIDAE